MGKAGSVSITVLYCVNASSNTKTLIDRLNVTDEDKTQKRVIAAPTEKLTPDDSLPVFAGFEVKGIQGEGGMAKVYLAVDSQLDRLVAIKMISSALSSDSDFRTRFQNEAKIVAQFRHPNIVCVFASGEIDDGQYIVMEFVDGGNLRERLASGALAQAEAIDVARQMADALSYSHARNIIHRDFKPANILFTEDHTPILSDFGVAKSATPEQDPLTRVGVVIGSIAYMSPEQARGETVTDRIDIYSFGRVLYEMLTGELPPRALADAEIEDKVRPALINHSPELVDLVCSCLRSDPAERPSAEECRQCLDNISLPVPSEPKPFGSWGLRNTMAVVGSVILIIALGITLAFLGKPTSTSTPSTVVTHVFDVDPPSATLYTDGVQINGTASLSSGGHSVVAVEPNHYGKVVEIEVGAESGETAIKLDPITLPTQDELGRFISAIEAPQVMHGDLQSVTELTLRRTLEFKRLADSGAQDELEQLENQLDILRSYDDPSSVVTLYLAAESEYLGRDSVGLLPRLQAAMNSGYALATFWYAIRVRDTLTSGVVVPGDPRFVQYCETMHLAYDQGLADVARRYLESDCSFVQ
jgi:tRNA A-37 threonylcarbamoyl transferase component Bud32